MDAIRNIPITEFMNYEIYSSPIAKHVSNTFFQKILGKYYFWKTKRKYNRYIERVYISKVLNGLQ